MSDLQYRPLQTQDAPSSWTLPDSAVIAPSSIFAHYDGSSAAGDFIPTLVILSAAGEKVASIPHDASVVSGSSVEATWAPFLRTAPAAAGGSGVLGGFRYGLGASVTLNAAANADLTLNGGSFQFGTVPVTADHITFDFPDGWWWISGQTFWHPLAAAPGSAGMVQHTIRVASDANPLHLSQGYIQPGIDGGGSINVDLPLSSPGFVFQASGFPGNSLVKLNAHNFGAGQNQVLFREDRTFLTGMMIHS